jgi:hypothetical protein
MSPKTKTAIHSAGKLCASKTSQLVWHGMKMIREEGEFKKIYVFVIVWKMEYK